MFLMEKPMRGSNYYSFQLVVYWEEKYVLHLAIWGCIWWNFNMYLYPSMDLGMSCLECLEFVVRVPKPWIWRQLVSQSCLHINLCTDIVLVEKTACNGRGGICIFRIILEFILLGTNSNCHWILSLPFVGFWICPRRKQEWDRNYGYKVPEST